MLSNRGRDLCDVPASGWRIDLDRSGSSYVGGDLGTHWPDAAEHVVLDERVAADSDVLPCHVASGGSGELTFVSR